MHQHAALIILAIIVIVIILIALELGYIIYLMNSDATDVSNLLHPKRGHHGRYEHFNPERNYPQPANSVLKEEPVELYYAAGNTEIPNDISHIRDDYYAKHVDHY